MASYGAPSAGAQRRRFVRNGGTGGDVARAPGLPGHRRPRRRAKGFLSARWWWRATDSVICVHFRKENAPSQPRVLIVAPVSGHFATLLRGTVERMLTDHDVYITDWINARNVPLRHGRFDLDDYIDLVIDYIRLLGPAVNVVAVCQPAVPVLAAVALLAADDDPAQPRTMTLMGGPIDPRVNPTAVNQHGHLALARLVRAQRHRHRAAALSRRLPAGLSRLPAAGRDS